MIALIAAIIFASVAILQVIIRNFIRPKENYSNN